MAAKKKSSYSFLAKFGGKNIYLIPSLAIPLLIPRFSKEARYYVGINGELGLRYVNTDIQSDTVIAFLIVIITAFMSFICEMLTVFKYHFIMKNGNIINNKIRQEFQLFGQALIILLVKLLMAICNFFIYLSDVLQNLTIMQMAFQHYVWIDNLLNLSGPIALFIVSKAIRKDYQIFWTGSRFGNTPILTSQQSSSNIPNRKENNSKLPKIQC